MYDVFEKLCIKKGVTPYRVCKETGLTTSTISNWKAGRYTPKQDKMQKIADYFSVSIDYLMNGDKKEINIRCNGLEGFQALLAEIYGSCEMEGVMGKYGECLYFSVGEGKNKYALEENDFDRLYDSVRQTVQHMTGLLLKNEEIVRNECKKAADTPPTLEEYEKMRNNGIKISELEDMYGFNAHLNDI